MNRSMESSARSRRWPVGLAVLLALVIAASACGGDDESASDETGGSTTTSTTAGESTASTTTAAPDDGGAPATTAAGDGEATASALEAELADAGIDCAGYTDTDPQAAIEGPADEGRCEVGEEIVYLYAFDDPDTQRTFIEDGGLFDCAFVSAFAGGATIPYATGDGWVIRPQSEEEAADIADALDGEADAVVCEPPGG